MKRNKQDLGKGLRSLLGNVVVDETIDTPTLVKELTHSIAEVDISKVEVNPYQPRNEFDPSALEELSASIKLHGVIQPITVRQLPNGNLQLISGERRLRASTLAGLKKIPAYFRIADDQQMLELALIENIQRKDLNAMEIAFTYQRLIDECELTHDALAGRVSKDRSTVTNFLRLLKLPPDIQYALKTEVISMGHARSLAGIDNLMNQMEIFRRIKSNHLNVRQTESLVKELESPKHSKSNGKDKSADYEIRRLEDKLTKMLETRTQIKQSKSGSGTITLMFASTQELNRLLERLEND